SHVARVKAQGSDAKGRGGANAKASFRLEPAGAGTKVLVHTDLSLSGSVAQYGRGVGMIQATAAQIMGQFANNLKAQLAERAPAAVAKAPSAAQGTTNAANASVPDATSSTPTKPLPAARPISGFSLMARVFWNAIVRLFTGRSQAS